MISNPVIRRLLIKINVPIVVYVLICVAAGRRARPQDPWRTSAVFPAIHLGLITGFLRGLPEYAYFARAPETGQTLSRVAAEKGSHVY